MACPPIGHVMGYDQAIREKVASLMNDGIRNVGRKILQQTPYEGLHKMLDLTYGALIDGSPLPVTAQDMLDASRLVDRLLSDEARL